MDYFIDRDMYGDESNVKAFLCKEKDCAVRHYDGEFKVISLASFIQSLTLPLAVSRVLSLYNVLFNLH